MFLGEISSPTVNQQLQARGVRLHIFLQMPVSTEQYLISLSFSISLFLSHTQHSFFNPPFFRTKKILPTIVI